MPYYLPDRTGYDWILSNVFPLQKGLYLHEIGHALGLVHEHQLPNRDSYIDILWDNVKPEWKQWFDKYSSNEFSSTADVPYDLSSVMHYGITVS